MPIAIIAGVARLIGTDRRTGLDPTRRVGRLADAAWFSFHAPVKTPTPVLDERRMEFARAVHSREPRQQLPVNGRYPVGDGPDTLRKTMRENIARGGISMRATHFVANA